MIDFFQEILPTIKKNKLRTSLTAFTVAWGIFLFIMLLSFGNGLKNGVMDNFEGRAKNSIAISPGRTSIGFDGFSPGRKIKFNNKDYYFVINDLDHVVKASPRVVEPALISYGKEFGTWNLEGTNMNIVDIRNISIPPGNGRFLNNFDIEESRKVIVINEEMKRILFKNENPLGKFVTVGDIVFEVVGVYDKTNRFQDKYEAYIPITLAQKLYTEGDEFHYIDFLVEGLDTQELNENYNLYLREKFGEKHRFDSNDRSALFVRNTYEAAVQATQIVQLIEIFITIVGLASLLAGIMGVSNIMIITVKERTREIGIRKAIGAEPISVIFQIVSESTFITAAAGYIGLLIGIGLTDWVNTVLTKQSEETGFIVFKDPSVDIGMVAIVTIVIIICGVTAGLIPAMRAAKIKPIEAMRDE